MYLSDQRYSVKRRDIFVFDVNKTSLGLTMLWSKNAGSVVLCSLGLFTCSEIAVSQTDTYTQLTPALTQGVLNISLSNNRLSIEAKQVSWQCLLAMLEKKTQIPIKSAKKMPSIVTMSIPAQPVTQALQELFEHRFDFVFQFSGHKAPDSKTPKAVWLLGNAENNVQAINTESKKTNGKPRITVVGNEALFIQNDQETVLELVNKAKNEINPKMRIQALARLVANQIDDTAIEETLESALKDNDPNVREYAVLAVANKEGEQATEHLRRALQDPDAEVRKKAAENVVLAGRGIALLKEALTNPDQSVQDIAAERLNQVTNESPENGLMNLN